MRPNLGVVVIGHVDCGKSTLTGHLLFLLGAVSKRQMQKYEIDSGRVGKGSFAYAWITDEDSEERSRGVTIDVGQRQTKTENYIVNFLDAPGHKDFVPNMISGAAQADVALLVVNAIEKEFEVGIDVDSGQTREHLILVKALGVEQIIVAVNKMDAVGWSQERFEHIRSVLGTLLVSIFGPNRRDSFVFVPCSALSGERLTEQCAQAGEWCKKFPTLVAAIDSVKLPERHPEGPLRFYVNGTYRVTGVLLVGGRCEFGSVRVQQPVIVLPSGSKAIVKEIELNDEKVNEIQSGCGATLTLSAHSGEVVVSSGSVICDCTNPPITVARSMRCRVMVLPSKSPVLLVKGFPLVFHCKQVAIPAIVKKIESQIDKTDTVIKRKPRCLVSKSFGYVVLEIEGTSGGVCVETFDRIKQLSKFTLRAQGQTVANGVVVEILK